MKQANTTVRRATDGGKANAALPLNQYALDQCKSPIACIRPCGRVFYANEAQCQQLGYSKQELVTKTVSDIDPDWRADAWHAGWTKLKEAGVTTFESRHRRKDGSIFAVEVTTNLIEHDGEEYMFSFTTDISDRKRAEAALRDSETKLRAIFDHHYQLTGMLDCEGRILSANEVALEFVGVDESEVIGKCFWETPWWDPSQRDMVRDAIERAAQGEFVRLECTHIRSDGAIRDFDFSLSPVRDDENNVMYLVPEGRDITELKQAERQLREHDAMIRDIVETSRDWIWTIDLRGIYTYCNPAIETILGYRPDELIGKSSLDLLHEEDRKIVRMTLPECIAARRGWVALVLRWRHRNGHWRYLESSAVPIVDDSRELLGFRGVDRDITDRLEAEEKLARMEAQLAHVARLSAMGEMAAGIAHEVSQPLYAIGNLARATVNAIEAQEQPSLRDLRAWNEAIFESAERANEIFTRMRTFARRESNDRSLCCVNEILRESVQLVAFEVRNLGAKIHQELPDPSIRALIDRIQIQQVLVNLLRNALEAMSEAESEVRDITIQLESNEESICVSVTDTGPGLSALDEAGVFEPFSTTKENGLGLGLAISTSIIEGHGGQLWVESAKSGGASFRFTLPALPEELDQADV